MNAFHTLVVFLFAWMLLLAPAAAHAQVVPTPDGLTSNDCLFPHSAFLPSDEEVDDNELLTVPDDARDPLLERCEAAEKQFGRRAVYTNTSGWVVDKSNSREFRDVTKKYLFNVAAVRNSRNGWQGVMLSRGVAVRVNGKLTTNWQRRILTNDSLGEYSPMVQKLSLGDFLDLEDLWKKAVDFLREKLPKLVADAIESLAKKLAKWVQEELTDLLSDDKTGPSAPMYLAQMQRAGASTQSVEEYVATLKTVRGMGSYNTSEKVFLTLSAPVTRTSDSKIGAALAKTIEQLK